jgi:hypothetical protein
MGREPQQEYLRIWTAARGRVVAGPFAGMPYIRHAQASVWLPKLLGVYELELWPAVKRLVARRPALVVNVGAGEGYYVAGLGRLLPNAKIVAFEAEEEDHDMLRALVHRNQLSDRVEVLGLCAPADLQSHLADASNALVVCDVEGAEDELLDPVAVPALSDVDILVEVHDAERPGVGDRLRARFEATHTIETIPARERTLADFPSGIALPASDPVGWISEGRAPTAYWLVLLTREAT